MEWNTPACHRQAVRAGRQTPRRNKILAGSIPSPANEIVAYRYKIRRPRRLAPAAPAPGCTATCTPYAYAYAWYADAYPTNAAATTAAAADTASAGSAARAAATATASVEATASPGCASAAAAASAASALGQLHAAAEFFFVEKLEGSEADVGKFFFAERNHHAGDEVLPFLNVTGRHGRGVCTSC
jgi:hypothetical protein